MARQGHSRGTAWYVSISLNAFTVMITTTPTITQQKLYRILSELGKKVENRTNLHLRPLSKCGFRYTVFHKTQTCSTENTLYKVVRI